jgi:transposase
MANRVRPIVVSEADHQALERLCRGSSTPAGLSRRARAVLLMAQGLSGVEIATRTSYTVVQISRLRRRFAEQGVAGLADRPRSGRPPSVSARRRAHVVALTLKRPDPGLSHWTAREMARRTGISASTVQRIWHAHALQPHRLETFKFSTDPRAEEKIYDVVGLYLNPPTNAVVLCLDEKTQVHLKRIARVYRGRELHLVVDNSSTHSTPAVKAWLAAHPRVHLHFTPTGASWLNLVESWFSILTRKSVRRGSFDTVRALIRHIEHYIAHWNEHPTPFVWTKEPAEVVKKAIRRPIH